MTWTEPDHILAEQEAAEGLPSPRRNGAKSRAAPHEDEAERHVLGAALLSTVALDQITATGLVADDFYRPAHQAIYEAVQRVAATGAAPDHGLVTAELRRRDLLEHAGGEAALFALITDAPGTGNAAHYAQLVTHTAKLRRLIGIGTDITEGAYTDDPSRIGGALTRLEDHQGPGSHAQRISGRLLTSDEIIALPPPEPLLAGLLQRDSLAMLYGPAGLAKTFLAIDWAFHIGLGAWWQNHEVDTGPVLYVVAEGVSGLGPRVQAWRAHHKLHTDPIAWYPEAINLTDPEWSTGLAQVVEDRQPALVVIDTYARCTLGADENSGKDTGIVIDHLDLIRRAAGSCVLIVHHTGKDTDRGARGHSALRGAVDTELELTGDRTHMVLKNSKQKNGPETQPIHLTLLDVAGSCVVVPAATFDPEDLPATTATVLLALEEIDDPAGVPVSWWKTSADLADRTFYRQRKRLVSAGLVTNVGSEKSPRYRPTHLLSEEP